MLPALYRMIYENEKYFFGKNSLNVPNVKLFSISVFSVFSFIMHFLWEWHLALYIFSDFPGIRNLSGLNDLNSLNDLNDLSGLNSLISSKYLLSMMLPLTWQQNDLSWSFNESTKIHYFMDFLPLLLLEAVEAMDVTFNQIQGS